MTLSEKKIKETDLAKPVADWLRNDGYTIYSEIPLWNKRIDLVGLKGDEVRVVELKLKYCSVGLRQVCICQLATSDVYLAVSKKPRKKTIEVCAKYGVGLLVVNGKVTAITRPKQVIETYNSAKKHLIENCVEPCDMAGMPCMSGCGPAQAVGAFVKEYVKDNPKAGWKEIYLNVPNHYSHYQSMVGAMSSYLGLTLTKLREANQ